ncbi:MAG: phosphoribosylanthranilate isomerase [Actinomycetota bacterium]
MFVKICGLTSEEDALLAVGMGADALGFNFVPGSKRQIAPQRARDIVRRLPPETMTVGIFRDELPDRVVDITHKAGLRAAQLHGRETAEHTRAVRAQVPIVVKAFSAGDPALGSVGAFGADLVLIDGAEPGSGEVFDWSLAEGAPLAGHRVLLAGGLHPGNVADAIRRVRPWGVDVASGVERAPGKKDPVKLREFVANARAAAEELRTNDDDETDTASGSLYNWEEDLLS